MQGGFSGGHGFHRGPGFGRRKGPPTSFIAITVALIQVVGTVFAASRQDGARPLDVLAFALLLAGPAALLLRRRMPVLMLPLTFAAALAYLLAGYPWGPVVVSFAVSLLLSAAAGLILLAWLGAGAAAATVLLWSLLSGDEAWPLRSAAAAAWAAILVLLGEGIRRRREQIAEYRRQRAAAEQAERDEYRLTLARDIHDVVAHSLSMINVQASVALHLGADEPERLRPALEAIKAASKESLAEVRQLLGVLREDAPLHPGARPGLARIPELVEHARQAGLRVELEGPPELPGVGEPQQEAAYRVVQEALSNVRRHSGASAAVVRLAVDGTTLVVTVDDDGAGLGDSEPGNGLTGMRERVEGLGGSLALLAPDGLPPNRGLRVEARIPLTTEEARP
ncbi:sensor histidine kinase [Arthrobacter celericrescens]|uniref:sensor histidine kinase n=1 Tax=Arthrobacter celericrescens TaxID=2320851 RepID=UPI000EA0CB1D|nr:sensor histidine kinase [Arthrobacter celericrescens]